jgi:hypothetical protein
MDQISTNAADQSQQPKHDKQRNNRPQHYSPLLIISSSPQVILTWARVEARILINCKDCAGSFADHTQANVCGGVLLQYGKHMAPDICYQ